MKKSEIDYWIMAMLKAYPNVSDLNITVGKKLQVESDGKLLPVTVEPPVEELTPFQAESFALALIDGDRRQLRSLVEKGYCDLSYEMPNIARFRVNIFTQRGCLTTVMRKLEIEIPTIEGMQFPESFELMAKERNGLILFTGATGTGKTTSLTSLINRINEEQAVHVVTLEDPIEFLHHQKLATINQRELGSDFHSFAEGMRAALRQAPKVILVGEMRDRETMDIALTAAETGHLVFSTLHTIDAGQTINRIISMFDKEEQKQLRNRLMDTVRWIVSQRLLPKVGGGRIAAMEILRTSLRIKSLILNGETEEKTFTGVLEEGAALGMWTFDQHLLDLYSRGLITEKDAVMYSSSRTKINRGLDRIKAERGESTSTLKDLSLEEEQPDWL